MIAQIFQWLTNSDNWSGSGSIPQRLGEHALYTLITIAIALVIAVPLGAWIGHTGRGKFLISAANAARALPTLGLLYAVAMMVGPLFTSELAFVIPSLVVLVLLAVPPLLASTYAGIEAVNPATRDAAFGMGMSNFEVLRKVEAPIALPLFLSGLRSAVLQVIATATIAAVLSLGGLGRFLLDGYAAQDTPQMVGGAVLVAGLALLADGLLAGIQKLVVSPGLTGKSSRSRNVATANAATVASHPEGKSA